MPANLPPQYSKAEEGYRRASSPAERLETLREMFRLLPKHKGTEKLQSDLKRKISQAKDDLEGSKGGAKKAGPSHKVARERAGQIVLVGAPNVGKSALLAALTNAKPEVAPHPYTTRAPYPGMMTWEDVRIQLIDLPPISADFMEPWVTGLIRSSDSALLLADLGDDDVADSVETVLGRLASARTELVDLPRSDGEDESTCQIRTQMVATKDDADGSADRLNILREWFGDRFPIIPISTRGGAGLDELKRAAYDSLGVFRIYTKVPGKPADRGHPFTLPIGSDVLDLAREVHRDLEHSLKYARIWGSGVVDGQTVKRDHELRDGDLVELHS